jgi:DNA-binding SARP family transcriptional activator
LVCWASCGPNSMTGASTSARGCSATCWPSCWSKPAISWPWTGLSTSSGAKPPPAAATASLQAYVSQLRRILEPDRPARAPAQVLVTQDPGYALRVDADDVDGSRFLRLAIEGRRLLDAGRADDAAGQLDQALALWRGPALVEFQSERWAAAAAARLAEARETALEDRIDA